jgi:NAD(P)-dependent dehydrogenase (short-subunit alcohol dehydrogenase family)
MLLVSTETEDNSDLREEHYMTTTTYGFETTAAEVAAGIDLSGKRVIVTGGASGIGIPTARALAGTGAAVTLAVRDAEAGERTAADIDGDVRVARLDLADPASVNAFTDAWEGPLHVLVNNAGVMAIQELTVTPQGYEMQFATNHLGHFALTLGLHDALAADGNARIVSVSSAGHLRSPVVFDDINFAFRPYDPWLAYGQSKTANILLAVEATRRWADAGITANALMPGGIATNLQRHLDPGYMEARIREGIRLKTPEQGAATSVLLAVSPDLEGVGGRYYEDCLQAAVVDRRPNGGSLHGVANYAVDPANAERLWEVSLRMLG